MQQGVSWWWPQNAIEIANKKSQTVNHKLHLALICKTSGVYMQSYTSFYSNQSIFQVISASQVILFMLDCVEILFFQLSAHLTNFALYQAVQPLKVDLQRRLLHKKLFKFSSN